MTFSPLTLGGFLELQIRNHPALADNWPGAAPEYIEKTGELFSVLCGEAYSTEQIIEMLSPEECMMAVDLGKRIVAGSLACAQQIEAAISDARPKIQFGWWGEAVVAAVRDLKLSVLSIVNLPLTPGTVSIVIQAIESRQKSRM